MEQLTSTATDAYGTRTTGRVREGSCRILLETNEWVDAVVSVPRQLGLLRPSVLHGHSRWSASERGAGVA
jgi:hypothetical protein